MAAGREHPIHRQRTVEFTVNKKIFGDFLFSCALRGMTFSEALEGMIRKDVADFKEGRRREKAGLGPTGAPKGVKTYGEQQLWPVK
jgi:hypothetical protein